MGGRTKHFDRLRSEIKSNRAAGRTIVLAHGVFDVLHIGHVQHLTEAKDLGAALYVVVTGDNAVGKGPGRPAFDAETRAEMVAALDVVDGVAVSPFETGVEVLLDLTPDVYVKGPDYEIADDDVTGGIEREREAVMSYGGELKITGGVTCSSSAIINRLGITNPPDDLREFLDKMREVDAFDRIKELMERASKLRVMLVGDSIIDEYRSVTPLAKPPKESILSVKVHAPREDFAGGVFALANAVSAIVEHVEVLTLTTPDRHAERLIKGSLRDNVHLHAHVCDGGTTYKTRYIEHPFNRKLFEVYAVNDSQLDQRSADLFANVVRDHMQSSDLVMVADFGHGLHDSIRSRLISDAHNKPLAVNAQTNSGNFGFNPLTKWRSAGSTVDFWTADLLEARLAVGRPDGPPELVASDLLERMGATGLVTMGHEGALWQDDRFAWSRAPAFTSRPVDTMGAGDVFYGVTAPLISGPDARRSDMPIIAMVGNAAAALKVASVGHRESVDKGKLLNYLKGALA